MNSSKTPIPSKKPMFAMVEGCAVPDLSGIHEGYSEETVASYHVFTINVSAENISKTFLRLANLPQEPVFFTIEVATNRDDEARMRKKETDPLHKDVYYLDGQSSQAVQDVFKTYERNLTLDGLSTFGVGSHHKNDEVFVGAYKVFYIYTVEPDKYRTALDAMGFRAEPKIKNVWQNFGPNSPGKRTASKNMNMTMWDVVAALKKNGMHLAERRED